MADFDNLWDDDMGFDVDSIDVDTNTLNTRAAEILHRDERNNINDDWLSDEQFDDKDKKSQWRDLITKIETNFNAKRDAAENAFAYKMDKINDKIDSLDPNSNKKEKNSLVQQLKQLKLDFEAQQKDLLWDAVELNFLKGRGAGFIPDPKTEQAANTYNYYNEHPEAVEKELATGKYEYKPTEL